MAFGRLHLGKKNKRTPDENNCVSSKDGICPDAVPDPPQQLTPGVFPPKGSEASIDQGLKSPLSPDQPFSTSSSTPGPFGDDKEIQQIWAEIQEKVNSLAAQAGKPVNKGMQLGDVMRTLESIEQPDTEPGKSATVKKVFGNTLKVIQTVGGSVADGASQVFPAASQCYNAIGFVINAWQGYQSAFDGLIDLFQECTQYIARVELYAKTAMGESLVKLTAKQLRLFVTICDHAIKLRHTAAGKIKTAFKIAFLGESKIQDLLGEMAKHVGEEHLLISAHTFLSAHEAMTASRSNLTETKKIGDQMVQVQSQVKDLHAATAKESELHEQNRTDAAIKSALDFGREIAPVWRDRYREYAKARLPSTGNWIFDDPKFALWKKGQAGAKILAVTGGSGTGKSFLATSIIHHFIHRDSPAETTDTRASAAFYYLEGDEVKAMQNDSSIDAIAKSLIWQLSTVDGRYKKSAAAICREYQTGDVATMSHRLLFECPYFDEVNGIFFIVVDGLEGKLGGGMLRFLQDVSAGHHIRVLVTCDLECSEHLKVNGLILEPLHIEAKNKPDVQAFIESRMNEMPALNNFADSSVRDLRRAVSDGLIHVTGGDYIRVSFALGEISKQEYPEKILSIVNNAGRQRAEQISAEIEELDRSLTDAEISEVNEIVLWIQHCKGPLTVVRMADALRARDGNAEKSLLRLSDKFKAKYTLFTVTNRGEVRFRAPEVEEAIPQRRLDHHELEQRNSTVLSQGEAEMIKHFLRMVCPPTTLSKLNVDALLARKQQDKFSWICQDDPNTGESKLALTCLRVLTDGVNKQENGLSSYARASFDRHLAAVDLAFVDVGLKALVGQHLVKLFTHETSIDALLCNRESSRFTPVRIEVCHKLLLQSDTANTIIRWLGDSAVTSKIEDQETKKWLLDVIHDGDHGKLLAPAAKRMAFHLVRQPHKLPLIRGAFSFVLYYIRKFEQGEELQEAGDPFKARVDEIEVVDEWCAGVLGIDERDSFWHSQIATILHACRHSKEAVQRARQALEIDPTNWRASSLLAQASRDPPLSSVAILKPVIHRLGSDKDWQQSDLNRAGLSTMFFILAEKTHKENFNEAINFAKSAIRIQPTDYSRISRFLQRCADKREWQLYVELLEAMCDSSKALEEQALNELMILCVFDMHQTEHFPTMLQAGLYTGRLQFIVDALGECAEMLETRGDRARLCHLRYHYGRGLHALHSGSPKALEQWRKAIEEGASPDLLSALIGNIAPYYLQKATKAAAANDDETASINLERIDTLLPEDIPKSSVMLLPAMYLIRYHVRKGDRAQAELLADEIVGRGIETLTDDIEDNDLPAYRELMWLFVALGDEQNVNAIRSLIIARFSDHRHANCDGDCGGSLDTADEMVWCQDCVNVKFEEKCYGKLHEVGFPLLFCNSTHEVLRLPKIDRPEDGHVLIGGGMVRVAEWIQSIQRRYSSAKQRSWENQDRSQIRATT